MAWQPQCHAIASPHGAGTKRKNHVDMNEANYNDCGSTKSFDVSRRRRNDLSKSFMRYQLLNNS